MTMGGAKRREERFFASLRMTMGGRLGMTKGECCHSEEQISPSLSF